MAGAIFNAVVNKQYTGNVKHSHNRRVEIYDIIQGICHSRATRDTDHEQQVLKDGEEYEDRSGEVTNREYRTVMVDRMIGEESILYHLGRIGACCLATFYTKLPSIARTQLSTNAHQREMKRYCRRHKHRKRKDRIAEVSNSHNTLMKRLYKRCRE